MSPPPLPTVLHYTGAENDRGGIMAVIRALAVGGAGQFESVLGVSEGFAAARPLPLPVLNWPHLAAERIGFRTWWRARKVAAVVGAWLAAEPARVFHGHSRAGLLVALQLAARGERRVVASVHCYGRQRWFYRHAARRLAGRLYWLSPAMKRYYGLHSTDWSACIPGCLPPRSTAERNVAARPRDGCWRLGGVGMLVRWKGWHDVLAALARLPAGVRERVRFDHIGAADTTAESAAYARELRLQTEALGLGKQVHWLGEQPGAAAFLATIDSLVVASRNEPLSIAMLEALQAGVPVLAADSGGALDVVRAGENGWFFPTGSPADLARVIAELVETETFNAVRCDPNGVQRFTAAVVAGQWAEVYGRL